VGWSPINATTSSTSPLVRGKDEIDLDTDPPPDLVIEVDISRSSLNRLEIYVALGVPEVWRFDGQVLRVYRLDSDGGYAETDRSPHFPFLPLADVQTFLLQRNAMDETSQNIPTMGARAN
jgi:Uma2 family endonuclease